MSRLENNLFLGGQRYIGFIDEAGRGSLAGPVVAACLLWDNKEKINLNKLKKAGIKDSKKLSCQKRKLLFNKIIEYFPQVGIGVVSPYYIDKENILQATFRAMRKAIKKTASNFEMIIIDGNLTIPHIRVKQLPVVKGDERLVCVSAASIIAKVTRDQIMDKYHNQYPVYFFNQNKGYGTKDHLKALKQHGPCIIHRKTFAPVKSDY